MSLRCANVFSANGAASIPAWGNVPGLPGLKRDSALKARFKASLTDWIALSALQIRLRCFAGRCPRLQMKSAFGAIVGLEAWRPSQARMP